MLSDSERVEELARLCGLRIDPEETAEVANRFNSLMLELDRLKDLDLSDIQPIVIFPEK